MHPPIEVAVRHGDVDQLLGMAQRLLELLQRAGLGDGREDRGEDVLSRLSAGRQVFRGRQRYGWRFFGLDGVAPPVAGHVVSEV